MSLSHPKDCEDQAPDLSKQRTTGSDSGLLHTRAQGKTLTTPSHTHFYNYSDYLALISLLAKEGGWGAYHGYGGPEAMAPPTYL